MDSSLKDKKFGVIHTTPTELVNPDNLSKLEVGKLYFAQGEASGAAKQGVYALTNMTDVDGVTTPQLTMFGCGALADANGAGLMSSTDYSKLAGIAEGANNYSHPVAGDGTIDTPSNSSTATTLLTRVKIDSSGHVTDTSAFNGTVGGTTTPIYFNAGVPTKLNYTIAKSVPSNAVFTDTWRSIKVNGVEKITTSSSTALDISGGTNIDVSYNNSKVVISVKNVDASTADTADKVANSLTIKGGGTTVKTFNGSTATTIEVKTGNSSTLTVTGANDGSITITPVTGAVSTSSNALTTGKQVADYVNTQLGNLSGALIYRGTVDGSSTNLPTTHSAGDVYVASAIFTTTKAQTGVEYSVEVGDYFISNGTIFNVVNGENQVTNENATLTIGGSKKVATVDGTDITISLPSSGYYTHPASISGTTAADSSLKSTTATTLAHAGTFTVATGVYRDASGHISKVATETFKLPSAYSHPAVGTTNTACTASANTDVTLASGTTFTVVNGVYRDASGHVNKVATTKYTMSADAFTDTKCTSLNLSVDSSVDVPTTLYADVISNTAISASGKGTSLSGTVTAVRVATQKAVDAAREAATIYWKTL